MSPRSHTRVQQSFGFHRTGVPVGEWLTDMARRLWPSKAALNLAQRAGVSHRTAELWFARQNNISGEALAELIRSDIGLQVLEGIVGETKPGWWPAFKAAAELDELERQQDEQRKRIEALRALLHQ